MSDIQSRVASSKERYLAEVARQIAAINSAIVVIWLFAVLGIIALSEADRQIKKADLINQEVTHVHRN